LHRPRTTVLAKSTTFIVTIHYILVSAFPSLIYLKKYRDLWNDYDQHAITAIAAHAVLGKLDPSVGQPGTFFRDSFPIRMMLAFWDLAEKEVSVRWSTRMGLD